MSTPIQKIDTDVNRLAEHARALIAATADATTDHVKEARKNLEAAMESGKDFANRLRDEAKSHKRTCEQAVRANPYQAIGIAVGIGLLFGFLSGRK